MQPRILVSALGICSLAAACASKPGNETMGSASGEGFPLANTSWELVEITTADKTVDPGTYTLTIRADGSAGFLLDCNRGFGSWLGSKDGKGSRGSIAFSGIGVTKALCPPGSISDQVTADLSAFDSFEFEDEYLLLTGENGAIVYRWIAIEPEQANDEQ